MKLKFLMVILLSSNLFADNIFINHYVFEWGERNPEIVERYLRSSVNNPISSYILGTLYLTGTILKKDLQKADWYITKAANMNLPEALNSIGDGYYSGDIRPQNVDMALNYYERAAKMGFGPAQFNAGVVLLKNYRSKQDLRLSIFYLDKASKNRNDLNDIALVAKRYKLDAEKKLRNYH